MTRERLYLYDTTLRDGAQTPGVDFSLEDKLAIIAPLAPTVASRWPSTPPGSPMARTSAPVACPSAPRPGHPRRPGGAAGGGLLGAEITEELVFEPSVQLVDLIILSNGGASVTERTTRVREVLDGVLGHLRTGGIDAHLTGISGDSACPGTSPAYVSTSGAVGTGANCHQRAATGGTGHGSEALLDLAIDVLDAATPGGCLDHFRRADAQLHVVLLSDTADGSTTSMADRLAALRATPELAASW